MAEETNVQPDPITTKSYSVHLLVSMLLLLASLVWAIYDEVEIMRPYKDYQARFSAGATNNIAGRAVGRAGRGEPAARRA